MAGEITAMRMYSGADWERAMKIEEIIFKSVSGKISWI